VKRGSSPICRAHDRSQVALNCAKPTARKTLAGQKALVKPDDGENGFCTRSTTGDYLQGCRRGHRTEMRGGASIEACRGKQPRPHVGEPAAIKRRKTRCLRSMGRGEVVHPEGG